MQAWAVCTGRFLPGVTTKPINGLSNNEIIHNTGAELEINSWTSSILASISSVANQFLNYLPTLLGAVLLLLLGWLIARVLGGLSRRFTEMGVNRLSRTQSISARVQHSKTYRSLPLITERIVYWVILFFFLAASLEVMGLPAVSKLFGYLTAYLPRVLVGIIIIVAGIWAGDLVRVFISRVAVTNDLERTHQLGYFVQALVIVLAVIIALEQLGIDNTILISLAVTVLGGIVFAAALSFGLGAKTTTANIIAAHYLRRKYKIGDRVRINDIEGVITEIDSTAITVDAEEGLITIPAEQFNVAISMRLK